MEVFCYRVRRLSDFWRGGAWLQGFEARRGEAYQGERVLEGWIASCCVVVLGWVVFCCDDEPDFGTWDAC